MKKILFILMLVVASINLYADNTTNTFRREGNIYSSNKSARTVSPNKETGFTWKDSKGNTYPIYMGATGSCYIIRVSSKTGKEYKQYLGAEVSADICRQLGVEYTPRNNNNPAN